MKKIRFEDFEINVLDLIFLFTFLLIFYLSNSYSNFLQIFYAKPYLLVALFWIPSSFLLNKNFSTSTKLKILSFSLFSTFIFLYFFNFFFPKDNLILAQTPPEECECTPGETETLTCSYCSDIPCPGGGTQYCENGEVTRKCKDDCTWGEWSNCKYASCSCKVGKCGVPKSCSSEADCPEGQLCCNGVCKTPEKCTYKTCLMSPQFCGWTCNEITIDVCPGECPGSDCSTDWDCIGWTCWLKVQACKASGCENQDGWYCSGDIAQYRDYYCGCCGGCSYDVVKTEDCTKYSTQACGGEKALNIYKGTCINGGCDAVLVDVKTCEDKVECVNDIWWYYTGKCNPTLKKCELYFDHTKECKDQKVCIGERKYRYYDYTCGSTPGSCVLKGYTDYDCGSNEKCENGECVPAGCIDNPSICDQKDGWDCSSDGKSKILKDYECDFSTGICKDRVITSFDCTSLNGCDGFYYVYYGCQNGQCVELSRQCSPDCGCKDKCEGTTFKDYICENNVCKLVSEETCSKQCGAQCSSDADCPAGKQCDLDTCTCVGGCEEWQIVCDHNCCDPNTEVCQNGQCIPKTTTTTTTTRQTTTTRTTRRTTTTTTCSDECSSGEVEYRCYGNTLQKRTCGDYDADPCLEWSSWQDVEDCNAKDGCYGLKYRDYYCDSSTLSCSYSEACSKDCGAACESDADCPAGYYCNLETCSCEAAEEFTLVSIEPSYTFPGDLVTLTIEVTSPNYHKNHDIEFKIYIDDEEWEEPYCNISKKLDVSKCMEDKKERHKHGIKEIHSEENYLLIRATCVIPPDIAPGTHKLTVYPTAYSERIQLAMGQTTFVSYKIISLWDLIWRFLLRTFG